MSRSSPLRAPWVLAAIVLLIAAETRFLGLGLRSLWFDEAYSVSAARSPIAYLLTFLHTADTHPPLYYAVLGGWIHLFGWSETAVRGLSALLGFLTVPLLYLFARQMVDAEAALVAAALLAGSAFAAVAAQEARMYPLLGVLALVSWSSLRPAAERRGWWLWGTYVLSTAMMLYTHYFGFLVLGSQVLYLLPLVRRDRRALAAAGSAVGAVLLLFLPWVPVFVAQATSGRGWPTFRTPADVRAAFDLFGLFGFGGEFLGTGGYFHRGLPPLWQEMLLALPVVCLVAAGAYALRGERAWCLACYWAVPIAMAAALSLRHNIFYTRYFSFLTPPFALLAAGGLDLTAAALARSGRLLRFGRAALLAGLVVVVLLANIPVANGYKWRQTGDYDWRSAAALVTRSAGASDYLLFVPGFARIPFEYYYRGSQGRLELTPSEVYRMVSIQTPPASKIDRTWARRLATVHPRVWIIMTAPVPDQAYLRLRDMLGDSFAPGATWDFNGVYVMFITSMRYGVAERSPGPAGASDQSRGRW